MQLQYWAKLSDFIKCLLQEAWDLGDRNKNRSFLNHVDLTTGRKQTRHMCKK